MSKTLNHLILFIILLTSLLQLKLNNKNKNKKLTELKNEQIKKMFLLAYIDSKNDISLVKKEENKTQLKNIVDSLLLLIKELYPEIDDKAIINYEDNLESDLNNKIMENKKVSDKEKQNKILRNLFSLLNIIHSNNDDNKSSSTIQKIHTFIEKNFSQDDIYTIKNKLIDYNN